MIASFATLDTEGARRAQKPLSRVSDHLATIKATSRRRCTSTVGPFRRFVRPVALLKFPGRGLRPCKKCRSCASQRGPNTKAHENTMDVTPQSTPPFSSVRTTLTGASATDDAPRPSTRSPWVCEALPRLTMVAMHQVSRSRGASEQLIRLSFPCEPTRRADRSVPDRSNQPKEEKYRQQNVRERYDRPN